MRLPATLTTAALLLSGCAATPMQNQPRSLQAQQELDRYLTGKIAGSPQSCLPRFSANDMIVVDDNTVLFRDGRRIWRTEMRGGCPGLQSRNYTLVTRQFGTGSLCAGEISQLVDLTSGISGGSCSFGEFVPYSPPPRR